MLDGNVIEKLMSGLAYCEKTITKRNPKTDAMEVTRTVFVKPFDSIDGKQKGAAPIDGCKRDEDANETAEKSDPLVGKDGKPITLATILGVQENTVLHGIKENVVITCGPGKEEPRPIQTVLTAGRPVWSVEEWKTNGVVVGYLFRKIAGEPVEQTYIPEESLGAALRLFRKQNGGSVLLDLSAVK